MKVLIVSDNFIEGEFLREALLIEDIDVCGVCTHDDVEKYHEKYGVSVIISLCHHNFFNGTWCADFFKNLNLQGSPKVFLLSSILHEQTVVRMYKGDVNQYYALPINMPRMVKNLSDQISKL